MATKKIVLCLITVLLIVFLPVLLTGDSQRRWIVWNVGQGQWLTLVENSECWHFDVGGEFAPWPALTKLCGQRTNRIFLSHWDHDHINFASTLARRFPTCMQSPPPGPTSHNKRKRIRLIPLCEDLKEPIWQWRPTEGRRPNDWSQIFALHSVLTPGDSPKNQERHWRHELAKHLVGGGLIRVLILGHHGSRTSTSLELLQQLPELQMAIVSARYKRYRHPHLQTVDLMRKMQIPLLRTEDWGSIVLEL